jgi:hypothetical protein
MLFLEQYADHEKDTSKLRNVQLEFLPANTSALQPMDQRIIRFLKHKYHRCLVCKFQQRITITKECYRVYFFDAISMHAGSWNAIGGKRLQIVIGRTSQ